MTGDCDDNLVCVLPAGATPIVGGKCERNNSIDLSFAPGDFATNATDFRVAVDAAVED